MSQNALVTSHAGSGLTPVAGGLWKPATVLGPKLYLSPSKISSYESCPRKYHYQYVRRWSESESSAALTFGNAMDDAVDAFLRMQVTGRAVDPDTVFLASWQRRIAERPLAVTATMTRQDMENMGRVLLQRFITAWQDSGLRVAVDPNGEPILQRELEIELPNRIVLRTKLDVLCITPTNRVALVDTKTAAQRYNDDWIALADQLTMYQIAVDAHAPTLGIEQIDELGFMTLIKRKLPQPPKPGSKAKPRGEGPTVEFPPFVSRRSDADVAEVLDKIQWLAEDIRRQRFPKRPGFAASSSCSYCSFASHCARQEMDGISLPQVNAVA